MENLNDVYIFKFNLLSVPQRGRPFLLQSNYITLFKRPATERASLVAHIIDPQALS
jgi:hypothetical protein